MKEAHIKHKRNETKIATTNKHNNKQIDRERIKRLTLFVVKVFCSIRLISVRLCRAKVMDGEQFNRDLIKFELSEYFERSHAIHIKTHYSTRDSKANNIIYA